MTKSPRLTDNFLFASREVIDVNQFIAGAPSGWTTDGTVAALSTHGGGVSLTTATTDNDPAALARTSKPILPAANKPVTFEAMIQFAEAATDDANVFVGLAAQAVTAIMQDDGAGPAADLDGFGFYKADGQTLWSLVWADGSTVNTLQLAGSERYNTVPRTAGSASAQKLRIDVIPKLAAKADVVFYIDGVVVHKVTDYDYSSISAIGEAFICKAGSTTAESMKVYYSAISLVR